MLVQRVAQEGWTIAETAEAFGVSECTTHKWCQRWREHGGRGLVNRSPRPQRSPGHTRRAVERRVCRLRQKGRLSAIQIAHRLQLARSTVGAILDRRGVARRAPAVPRAGAL